MVSRSAAYCKTQAGDALQNGHGCGPLFFPSGQGTARLPPISAEKKTAPSGSYPKPLINGHFYLQADIVVLRNR